MLVVERLRQFRQPAALVEDAAAQQVLLRQRRLAERPQQR
jgi:hypothetical protein